MAPSEAVWLDSDVFLDWLCKRQPWNTHATELLSRAVDGHWLVFTSALSLANVFYIHRKQEGSQAALEGIKSLMLFVRVAPMEESHVFQALSTGYSDFEGPKTHS